jgi:uncharacterized protein (TIGR03067 family)
MNGYLVRVGSWASIIGFTVCLLIGAGGANAAPPEAASELNGNWRLIAAEFGGETTKIEDDVRWLIKDDTVFYGGEPLATMTTYPQATPNGIDLHFKEPKNDYEGIYVIENGQLRVCLNTRTTGPKERPADFETKDKRDNRVFVFEHLTPDEAGAPSAKGFVGMALAIENMAVVISDIIARSPAEKAGLRAGDVLLRIGNQVVTELQATVDLVRREQPGAEIVIQIRRESAEKEIKVKVAAFPFSLLGLLG